MGQQVLTSPSQPPPSFQQLEDYVDSIFSPADDKLTSEVISLATQNIMNYLRANLPAELIDQKMQINLVMLKVFYQTNFVHTLLKLIKIFTQKLQEFNNRNLLLIKRQQFTFFLNLTHFILFFTDDKLTQTMESLVFRNDLTEETHAYIIKLESKDNKFIHCKIFFDKLSPTEAKGLHESLEKSLVRLITSRTQILTRSSQTFQVINEIEQSLFIFLMKLIKTPHHNRTLFTKIRNGNSLKSHLKIGQYFLGQGCDQCRASVYESSVLLLLSLIDKNSKNLNEIDSQITSLPTHLFKKIPIIIKNTFYHFVSVVCLIALEFVKQGSEYYIRFSCNRIPTLRLLNALIGEMKVTSPQMTQLLEKISLQTKIGSIQRAFVTQIVEKYNKLVKEKIKQNKRIEEIKKTTSGFANKFLGKLRSARPNSKPSQLISQYSTESFSSQILQKYLISGSQPYKVKYGSRMYVISSNSLTEQFERNEECQQKQFQAICQRFTYEIILKRNVTYRYLDSVEWNLILPKIIRSQNLFGEEVRSDENEKMNGLIKQRKIVGSMPVIRQRYIGNLMTENQSPLKNTKKNARSQYLQTEAQGIYQQTSQDQRVQEFRLQNKVASLIKQETHDKAQNSKKNEISLVFEQQEHGDIEEIDETFQSSELQLNKNVQPIAIQHKQTNRSENKQIEVKRNDDKDN